MNDTFGDGIAEYQAETSLLFKYIKGEASEQETSIIELWMDESDDSRAYVLSIAKIYFANETKERITARDSKAAFKKVQNRISKKQNRVYFKQFGVVAACLVGILLLSYTFGKTVLQERDLSYKKLITIVSNPGVRTHFVLPDSTSVWLNSNSKLSYTFPFEANERKVFVSGEAWFNVSHKPEQPFIVTTNKDNLAVKVLGTKFNVQAYPADKEIKVTLIDGEVNVAALNNEGQMQQYALKPSEQVTYNTSKQSVSLMKINPNIATAWIDGKLIFKNTPMPEVFRQLQYFYNVNIIVKDKEINKYYFTGTFQNKQLPQILKYIELTSGVCCKIHKIESDDDRGEVKEKIIISKKLGEKNIQL